MYANIMIADFLGQEHRLVVKAGLNCSNKTRNIDRWIVKSNEYVQTFL